MPPPSGAGKDCGGHEVGAVLSVTCDNVTTIDNQSSLSIHGYVCEGWERLPMLLSLEHVVVGAGSNNLTTFIVNVVKNYGGLDNDDLVGRMASFGASMPF